MSGMTMSLVSGDPGVAMSRNVRSLLCYVSVFTGLDPTTYDGMILYYRRMTKVDWLGDSIIFSRVGLSHYLSRKLLHLLFRSLEFYGFML
jgi:hypothetical protein